MSKRITIYGASNRSFYYLAPNSLSGKNARDMDFAGHGGTSNASIFVCPGDYRLLQALVNKTCANEKGIRFVMNAVGTTSHEGWHTLKMYSAKNGLLRLNKDDDNVLRLSQLDAAMLNDAQLLFPCLDQPNTLDKRGNVISEKRFILISEAKTRTAIFDLEDLCPEARVRRSLSYDSIIVDLLRHIRGYHSCPALNKNLFDENFYSALNLNDAENAAECKIVIVVRINTSALLRYRATLVKTQGGDHGGEWCVKRLAEPGDKTANCPKSHDEEAHFYAHCKRPAPINTPGMGRMKDYGLIIAAFLCSTGEDPRDPLMHDPYRSAILAQMIHFERGLSWLAPTAPHSQVLDEAFSDGIYTKFKSRYLEVPEWQKDVSASEITIPKAVSHKIKWHLMHERLNSVRNRKKPTSVLIRTLCIWSLSRVHAERIEDVLLKKCALVKIGKLQLVDRHEIEEVLAVRDALLTYEGDRERTKPLNLAVFGSPGSGKSFCIKEILGEVSKTCGYDPDPLEFNVSQFSGIADFTSAFQQVRNACLKGKTPVVFFDEFDCTYNGTPFGWLKNFLAPMQDGTFSNGGFTYNLGKCVFVFAGGVNQSFSEFTGRMRNPSFIEAKGPDFISRLRDHLNIRGIDMPPGDNISGMHYFRRTLMLQYMLAERLAITVGKDKTYVPEKLLHKSVARAFVETKSFRHGARSMEAILDICQITRGKTLGPSELPPVEQLNMHVDAAEFMGHVYDVLSK